MVHELNNCCLYVEHMVGVKLEGYTFRIFPFVHDVRHCLVCRPSDYTVSEDAEIGPRTIATMAVDVRRSNHSAKSHPIIFTQYKLHICAQSSKFINYPTIVSPSIAGNHSLLLLQADCVILQPQLRLKECFKIVHLHFHSFCSILAPSLEILPPKCLCCLSTSKFMLTGNPFQIQLPVKIVNVRGPRCAVLFFLVLSWSVLFCPALFCAVPFCSMPFRSVSVPFCWNERPCALTIQNFQLQPLLFQFQPLPFSFRYCSAYTIVLDLSVSVSTVQFQFLLFSFRYFSDTVVPKSSVSSRCSISVSAVNFQILLCLHSCSKTFSLVQSLSFHSCGSIQVLLCLHSCSNFQFQLLLFQFQFMLLSCRHCPIYQVFLTLPVSVTAVQFQILLSLHSCSKPFSFSFCCWV